MTTDDNKALVRRFISEIFEQGRVGAVDELCAEDFIGHTWGEMDREGLKKTTGRVSQSLADIHFTVEDEIARVTAWRSGSLPARGRWAARRPARQRSALHDRRDPHLPFP